jgi:hypothetical protein
MFVMPFCMLMETSEHQRPEMAQLPTHLETVVAMVDTVETASLRMATQSTPTTALDILQTPALHHWAVILASMNVVATMCALRSICASDELLNGFVELFTMCYIAFSVFFVGNA